MCNIQDIQGVCEREYFNFFQETNIEVPQRKCQIKIDIYAYIKESKEMCKYQSFIGVDNYNFTHLISSRF